MKEYDVTIIGAGPSGMFAALELSKNEKLKIALIDKGKKIEDRICPAIKNKTNCVKCKVCSIMSGISGAGANSDGKFPITNDFGGYLWEKIGKEKALELMKKVDDYNRLFFAKARNLSDDTQIDEVFPKLYSTKNTIYKKICTQHNLHLLDADIRHLGTDIGKEIYSEIYKYLERLFNIDIYTETEVTEVKNYYEPNSTYVIHCFDNKLNVPIDDIRSKIVIIGAGRTGSEWVKDLCKKFDYKYQPLKTKSNRVDIGIRFECPNEIWNHITKDLYESKIIYRTKTYEDEVRTFCMNPSGYVVTENTSSGITVNGHSYEDSEKASSNTNFALLVSKTFTEPFDDSNEYGASIIKLSNMLGGGVIVQRYGDLIRGKRSTKERIKHNSVIPTLNAEPGDLSLVLPKRILDDILEMVDALDHLVPGMKNDDNLLYGVECKFYNSVVETKNNCEAEYYKGLYFIGDGAGVTHSLSQSAANGLYVAEQILTT